MAFLVAKIIYPNGQRPGAVINMTIEEFEAAEEQDEDKMMITVRKHKTAKSLGPIRVVIDSKDHQRMKLYKDRIRSQLHPLSEDLSHRFFLTFTGNEFRKVNEWIQEIAAQYHLDAAIPNPTIHRKWIDSTAHGECTESEMRVLNAAMSHSEATSRKHYQKQKAEHALQSAEQIKQLTKKFFTKEDTIITAEYPITTDETPTLFICQKMIDRHPQLEQRQKKHIQDRWRILKKKAKQNS